ncbi:MAG: orotidine-5'-phosphate decarboxylase [Hyphomicrobiales bacterium]|nr:orotidine-5'-phosphate decarboxylase [Hyphomicrobiales bacterium]MDE2017598.1 orotidine-5'-phosphate decarboxylase [Hyphomicrobiales bacterium]
MDVIGDARDRLIVGLDLSDPDSAREMVARLGDDVSFYKIGMELVYGGGLDLVAELVGAGKKVFLDLKLHDIPNTVAAATRQVARLGATYLTVHAYPQTMRAAREAAGADVGILGVTALTSASDADLAEAGYAMGARDLVLRRARQATEAGIAGVVASAEEAAAIRAAVGDGLRIVTPGIRPANAEAGDQKRVMTPAAAIASGADRLVVARPIIGAADPRKAARDIVREIEVAARKR